MNYYSVLADLVVLAHLAYVLFVLFGLVTILAGWALGWQWVRNFWFRMTHLVMIGIVVVEALLGIVCPLTTWEHALRRKAGQAVENGSFVGGLAHDLLFIEAEPWMFTIAYCLFGAAVLVTFVAAPPRWPSARREPKAES